MAEVRQHHDEGESVSVQIKNPVNIVSAAVGDTDESLYNLPEHGEVRLIHTYVRTYIPSQSDFETPLPRDPPSGNIQDKEEDDVKREQSESVATTPNQNTQATNSFTMDAIQPGVWQSKTAHHEAMEHIKQAFSTVFPRFDSKLVMVTVVRLLSFSLLTSCADIVCRECIIT